MRRVPLPDAAYGNGSSGILTIRELHRISEHRMVVSQPKHRHDREYHNERDELLAQGPADVLLVPHQAQVPISSIKLEEHRDSYKDGQEPIIVAGQHRGRED